MVIKINKKLSKYSYSLENTVDFEFTDNEELDALSASSLIARSEIPDSHKRIADNYILIKKVYGFPVIQGQLSFEEKSLLDKYDFNRLEFSTIKQINEELNMLKAWSASINKQLRSDSDKLLAIRAKELKFLVASKYTKITNELFTGYIALERYFEIISKLNNDKI